MALEVTVPSPGESVSEVEIAQWLVQDGDHVEKDQTICELDSDKATLEVTAEEAGTIKILVQEGEAVNVGDKICTIDTTAEAPAKKDKEPPQEEKEQPASKAAADNGKEKTKDHAAPAKGGGKPMDLTVPSPGESVSQVEIAQWLVSDGDYVEKDQAVCELDSDKATLELTAEMAGGITISVQEGETVNVGDVVATIDPSVAAPEKAAAKETAQQAQPAQEPAQQEEQSSSSPQNREKGYAQGHPSPAAKKLMNEQGVGPDQVNGTGKGGRILKQDVLRAMAAGFEQEAVAGWGGTREEKRSKMSTLRRKVADRLVSVKNETAMLTTFNEVDMSYVMDLRKQYKEEFKEHHGVSLGFMSFFTKAVTEALNLYPDVNSIIDGDEIVAHQYADVGIAVSSPKGLMVPVLRNAEQMSLAEIESEIKRLATKARDGKITLDEMSGGTFTITNGGVFGSMLSTPIINPPQSAILGMHNIVERPVAVEGKVEVRPVMYVALSYDHRIIDGKDSVGFLYAVKEMIESPERLIFGGKDPMKVLLGL